ncbi:MAG: EAL domain-containing protein [Steroidobacteraceae bacterium]
MIEVLEDVRGDADVIAGLRRLRAAGYGVALDDYTSRDGDARLLEVADIVKIDLSLEPADGLARLASELRRRPLRLLAEKVESREQFELRCAAGFDLFQGYFLQRPETFSASRPPGQPARQSAAARRAAESRLHLGAARAPGRHRRGHQLSRPPLHQFRFFGLSREVTWSAGDRPARPRAPAAAVRDRGAIRLQ